jgi:hypothetical protein
MNSTAFSLSANSNLKVDRNQVTSTAVDFQPHPPNLTPVFGNLDQEMDLTIRSLNFALDLWEQLASQIRQNRVHRQRKLRPQ